MADGSPASAAPAPLPTRRDLHFRLPAQRISDWHGRGPHVSQFMNTLSIFFPVGERFFIQSVRNYRDQITDPELQKAMTAFIGQEAMHGREHEDYNALMTQAGLPAEPLERHVIGLLGDAQKRLPHSMQLSATIALEHLTAILADQLLAHPEAFADSHPAFVRLWNWHALEETEHKAVAYDVWKAVMKPGLREYAERTGGLVIASAIFWYQVARFYRSMVQADPKAGRTWRGYREVLKFTFGKPGPLRKGIKPWLDYFHPGFHPWQHDNRHFLDQLPDLERALAVA